MGGTPSGIETLTPRVQAQDGFFANKPLFLLPNNLANLQNQRFNVGISGGQTPYIERMMKSFPLNVDDMGVASVSDVDSTSSSAIGGTKFKQAEKNRESINTTDEFITILAGRNQTPIRVKNPNYQPEGEFRDVNVRGVKTKRFFPDEKIDMDEIANNVISKTPEFRKAFAEDAVAKAKKDDVSTEDKKTLSFEELVAKEDDDVFKTEFDRQYKRIEQYLGEDKKDLKGELALALSDAVGTPGTLADKAKVLNSFLLQKASRKKANKRDFAKLAFAAANDLEKAKILANKETFEEKRYNKLFTSADIIANPDKYSESTVNAAKSYLKTTKDIQDLLKNKEGDFTLTGATVAKTLAEIPETKKKLAKELAKGDKARPEKIKQYRESLALAQALLSKDLNAISNLVKLDFADGGRVNLAQSFEGTVGEAADVQKTPAAKVDRLDYNALRTRLPREITDDIVRLLANDDQALQDFSYIRTQGDVNQFNLKYGVTLVLPPESA
tara:strand:+ start:31 stop:1527 length:1497 start_codon:yes stop_codon:yes gene_type:complete